MTKCNLSQEGYDVFKPQCFPVSQIPLMGLTSNSIICHPYLSLLCPQLRLNPESLSLCFRPHEAPHLLRQNQALPQQSSLTISQEHLLLIWSRCAPGLCLRLLLPTSPIFLPHSIRTSLPWHQFLLTVLFFQMMNSNKMKVLLKASLRLNAQHSAWRMVGSAYAFVDLYLLNSW